MEQREVSDVQGTRWTCVQAFAGLEGKAGEKANEISESADGNVTVVCTPSGGAQTVRLQLAAHWIDQISDEELIKAIESSGNREAN